MAYFKSIFGSYDNQLYLISHLDGGLPVQGNTTRREKKIVTYIFLRKWEREMLVVS